MRIELCSYWDRLRSSLCFLPLVMSCRAVVFAVVALDTAVTDWWRNGLGLHKGAEGLAASEDHRRLHDHIAGGRQAR
jgi:hypothetical protein